MLENEAKYSTKARDILRQKRREERPEPGLSYNEQGGWEVCETSEELDEGGILE